MNNLTKDFIAVDTNVFEHLFNRKKNVNQHISKLIKRLYKDKIRLLIDAPKKDNSPRGDDTPIEDDSPIEEIRIVEEYKGSRIMREYRRRLFPYASHVEEQNSPRQDGDAEPQEVDAESQEKGAERILLDILLRNPERVYVNQADNLMRSIKGIIEAQEGKPVTDRFFVYVAFKKDRMLVTNDRGDILSKKEELKRRARRAQKRRLKDADILSSQEAYEKIRIADSNFARGEPNHE